MRSDRTAGHVERTAEESRRREHRNEADIICGKRALTGNTCLSRKSGFG